MDGKLWTERDEEDVERLLDAERKDDLLLAVLTVEGATADELHTARRQIRSWGQRVRMLLDNEPLLSEAEAMRTILVDHLGFKGERNDYYHPQNSFLTVVMERRKGLPISLSAIWICVGQEAGLIVQGIGLPGHFITSIGNDPTIYVDPFDGGTILTAEDCKAMLDELFQNTREWKPEYLKPVTTEELLERVLLNLINAHTRQRDPFGLYRILHIHSRLRPDLPQLLLQRGRIAEKLGEKDLAADAYDTFLERFPEHDPNEVLKRRRDALFPDEALYH